MGPLLYLCNLVGAVQAHGLLDPDLTYPGAYEEWYGESLGTAVEAHLHVEGQLPSWLDGVMFNAGPSQQGMGKEHFMHIFDGFARVNKFDFKGSGNILTFTSKMLETEWYNTSLHEGRVAAGVLMAETEPPRPFTKVPLVNALATMDNVYVVPWKIGESYLYLTDSELRLRFDPDTLHIVEEIAPNSYTGDAQPTGQFCPGGSAHVLPDPSATLVHGMPDGSFIGIMGCQPTPPRKGQNSMVVYRVSADNVKHRKMIAQIDVPMFSYMHSFSITKRFVILPAQPYYIAGEKLAFGATVSEAFWFNTSHHTKFFVVDIETGKVRELQTPGFLFIHTANAFEQDSKTIVLDISGVSESGFIQQGLKSFIMNKTWRDDYRNAYGKLNRYTLHLDSGLVEVTEPVKMSGEGYPGLVRFNENMRGMKTCFIYAFAMRYNCSSWASMAAVKLDLCSRKESARFYEHAHFHSEVIFVPRPGGVAEDDGVLMGVVYDGVSQQSYVNVLDAMTMQQVAKAYLPFKVPFLIHSNFFPRAFSYERAAFV
jgi:carotenoid cleavage dioxygenase-like enzyme